MRAEFLNEIHDVQILRTFRLVRGLISVLQNLWSGEETPLSISSCRELCLVKFAETTSLLYFVEKTSFTTFSDFYLYFLFKIVTCDM